jgi:hypothetical protein
MPTTYKILDPDGKETSEASVIAKYFRKEGQTMTEFYQEIKALTPHDKTDLAVGVAKALGFTLVEAAPQA